ncbi:MAG: HTTM domain-containing protein [Armatimonadetes bacterium]|nr:HTTM domain-containing protein [Armatimonadota bacterium]
MIRKWWSTVDRAVFGYGSPFTMGVFRAIVGTLALVNYLMLSIDFEAWFTEKGYYPVAWATRWAEGIPRLNLLEGVTDTRVTAALYALMCLAALFTAAGLFTRVASIALFVLMTTFAHRSPDILHSGDTILRQYVFLIALAPSGAAFSLDRLLALRKGTAPVEPALVSMWPQRLVQYQLAIVYFTTVWHKAAGDKWWNGTAVHFPWHLHEFDKFPVPPFLDTQPMVAVLTYGTIFIELALATLVFARPLRKWVLLGGLMLHAGIEFTMNIPLFAFIICSGYISHYDGEEVKAWFERVLTRLKLKPAEGMVTIAAASPVEPSPQEVPTH